MDDLSQKHEDALEQLAKDLVQFKKDEAALLDQTCDEFLESRFEKYDHVVKKFGKFFN